MLTHCRHRWLVSAVCSSPSCDRQADPALVAAVRLSLVTGVGPRVRQSLLDAFETPEGVFDASPAELRSVPGTIWSDAEFVSAQATGATTRSETSTGLRRGH